MLQTKSHVKYTIQELLSYVKDPNSSVHRITDRLHIGLPPAGLANFKEAVVDSVTRAKVGRFDQKLNGIVLDVRNYKVLGNVFPIQNDDPQLHVDLNADLYVFQPTKGAIIKGVIKHIAYGHISVTVHRVFNVAIRLAGGKEGLKVNMEIAIRITDFDLSHKLPFIEGLLHEKPKLAKKNKLKFDVDEEDTKPDLDELNAAENDESSSDESDFDSKAAVAQYLEDHTIKIKSEPQSDSSSSNSSDSEATQTARDDRRTAKRLKREASVESSSSSDSDAVDHPVAIKQEKVSSSSSDSSDDETATTRTPLKSVKKEASTNSDSSSDSDSGKKNGKKQKRMTVDSLFAKVMAAKEKQAMSGTKKRKVSSSEQTPQKTKRMDETLANLSQFATPGLSSTMIPEAEKSSKKKKSKK